MRHTIRRKDGKVHRDWRLARSVRVGRRVIQQTVAHLGELDARGRIEARALSASADRRREAAALAGRTPGIAQIAARIAARRRMAGRVSASAGK